MLEYNPETHVAVPKEELAKLEESRAGLYDFLTEQGFFGEMLSCEHTYRVHMLLRITKQIWNVANRIKWEK